MLNRTKIFIPKEDEDLLGKCRVDTMRSSGKGGQHVNTTDSAVRLTHLETGVTVRVQQSRSQHKNKELALRLLRKKLGKLNEVKKPRKKTKISRSVKENNLNKKKKHSVLKKNRSKVQKDLDD